MFYKMCTGIFPTCRHNPKDMGLKHHRRASPKTRFTRGFECWDCKRSKEPFPTICVDTAS